MYHIIIKMLIKFNNKDNNFYHTFLITKHNHHQIYHQINWKIFLETIDKKIISTHFEFFPANFSCSQPSWVVLKQSSLHVVYMMPFVWSCICQLHPIASPLLSSLPADAIITNTHIYYIEFIMVS